jgi:hypothetical protein
MTAVNTVNEEAPELIEAEEEAITHYAFTAEIVKGISAYFQTTKDLTWDESNQFVVALTQGVPLVLRKSDD